MLKKRSYALITEMYYKIALRIYMKILLTLNKIPVGIIVQSQTRDRLPSSKSLTENYKFIHSLWLQALSTQPKRFIIQFTQSGNFQHY